MALPGAKPKPEGQKVTRHPLTQDWSDVPNVAFDDAPNLPKHPSGKPWPIWTKRWWRVISTMPHCVNWTESDWQYAFETTVIAAEFHSGDLRQAKELRDRERKMAITADDRRDQRIRYVDVAEPQERRDDDAAIDFEAERRKRLMEAE